MLCCLLHFACLQSPCSKHLLLEFPYGHEFTSKEIYEDAGDEEELDFVLLPLDGYHEDQEGQQTQDENGEPITYPSEKMGFVVGRIDTKTNKRGKVEQKPKMSKAAARMAAARMNAAGTT